MNLAPLYESLQLSRKLSLAKIQNAALVAGSYQYARLRRQPVHRGMPISLSIEPTTHCNLRCPECPSGLRSFSRPTGLLDTGLYERVLEQTADTLIYLLLYFQGEPYLHPNFFELVQQAHRRKIYTATSTNAHFLSEERARLTVESGLDRLIISIDGTTQETYSQYRIGGSLEKVLEGTRRLLAWKKKLKSASPHIIFQFLVVRPNEHQLEEVKALAKQLGVDEVRFKTAQIYDYEGGSDLIPSLDRYSRYRQTGEGRWEIKNSLLNQCWKMWHSCVITWDGRIVPCCFDKDAAHALGNLEEQSFRDIWQGPAYQNFRQALLKGRDQIEICRNCTEGGKVWA